ncbi:MAG: LacI family DNA-binding transcriptional regulator, partial [Caldilineaceae bacterium]|nr:LacI family DNA-binding transcriptional regulator [Caldilineaceae bacterium]
MTTIRDVAKRAGVAPITVSRVLNNSGYVSDDTRARVMVAAVELNYVPNMLAR